MFQLITAVYRYTVLVEKTYEKTYLVKINTELYVRSLLSRLKCFQYLNTLKKNYGHCTAKEHQY